MGVWRSFAIGGNMVNKFVNKLVEWEAVIDPLWIACNQLKDEFLLEIFAAFCVPVV